MTLAYNRYRYAGPYKTRAKAEIALEDCFATGEVSLCEKPDVEKHENVYYVTLEDDNV